MADEDRTPATDEPQTPVVPDEKPDTPTTTDVPWRELAKKNEARAKESHKRVEELERELTEIKAATQSDQEKALDKARKEGAKEARETFTAELRKERREAAVARLAAGKFQDVDVAMKLLEVDDADIFGDDNTINAEALAQSLDDLLKRAPYLSADPASAGRPAGDADAGKGNGGALQPDPAAAHNSALADLFGAHGA